MPDRDGVPYRQATGRRPDCRPGWRLRNRQIGSGTNLHYESARPPLEICGWLFPTRGELQPRLLNSRSPVQDGNNPAQIDKWLRLFRPHGLRDRACCCEELEQTLNRSQILFDVETPPPPICRRLHRELLNYAAHAYLRDPSPKRVHTTPPP